MIVDGNYITYSLKEVVILTVLSVITGAFLCYIIMRDIYRAKNGGTS